MKGYVWVSFHHFYYYFYYFYTETIIFHSKFTCSTQPTRRPLSLGKASSHAVDVVIINGLSLIVIRRLFDPSMHSLAIQIIYIFIYTRILTYTHTHTRHHLAERVRHNDRYMTSTIIMRINLCAPHHYPFSTKITTTTKSNAVDPYIVCYYYHYHTYTHTRTRRRS